MLKQLSLHWQYGMYCWLEDLRSFSSLVADVVLDGVNASIKLNGILLNGDLLLDQSVHLLFEEVALVDVVGLQLLVVLLEVGDVLDDLL